MALEHRKEGTISQSDEVIKSSDAGSSQSQSDQKAKETLKSRDGESWEGRNKDGVKIDVDTRPRPGNVKELLMWMEASQGPLDALLDLGRRVKAAATARE